MVIDAESSSTDEDPASQHSKPSVRLCKVDRNESGSCGFHLTRTKWDPYPWIAGVDEGSPAQAAGLRVGDCLLEVNGEDVLGLRVGEIANKAQTSTDFVSMLLWNAGSDSKCDSELIEEIDAMIKHNVWTPVRRTDNMKPIPVQWLFVQKDDGSDRARLVVTGCKDPEAKSYTSEEKTSPTPSSCVTVFKQKNCKLTTNSGYHAIIEEATRYVESELRTIANASRLVTIKQKQYTIFYRDTTTRCGKFAAKTVCRSIICHHDNSPPPNPRDNSPPQSLCCTPMPTSLSRLSSCLSSILSFLECPICFEIISPPAHQCPFGHLICFRCRVCIERCPVCRTNFTRERSLLADQIYNSIIEAFHLKEHQSTSERTAKLWERVFGRSKKRERNSHSTCSTPRMSRASELKNKFLTRLIGKATSVDNLTAESNYTANLRKKSISSTDIYPESLKRLNYLHQQTHLCSSDSSLPNANQEDGIGALSRYSSTNSCETLAGRNLPYFSRVRSRNLNKDNGGDNLFQFSSDTTDVSDAENSSRVHRYYCPLSQTCTPLTAFALLTHLQQHDGPIIQFFNSRLTINFPFSFENGAIIIVHCYEKTFFLRLLLDEVGDMRLCVWLLGSSDEAAEFRFQVTVRRSAESQNGGDSEFTATVYSIQSTERMNQVYKYPITIANTNTTLLNHFQDRPYSLDMYFIKIENT